MKEWLTVIVVLLIIGILLDGWRRMRLANRDNIRVSKRVRQFDTNAADDTDEFYTSELPNGGARVIAKRKNADGSSGHGNSAKGRTETNDKQIPQQVSLNLDESVPMLMESVEAENKVEPTFGGADSGPVAASSHAEPGFSALDDDGIKEREPAFSESSEHQPVNQPDEVIIINGDGARGPSVCRDALLDVLLQCGLRYGDMNIFHRHEQDNGEGPIQFSLANMVKPGTFDLDNMANFSTPGVSMFLTLPMATDSIKAFDIMRHTAQTIAEILDGELKDEQRSVMTRQTMEHYRQRIVEYERKRLSRANS